MLISDPIESLDLSEVDLGERPLSLLERLQSCRFNIHEKPEESEARFVINDVPVSTVGNLTALAAPPKHGKSSVLAAMMGAVITPEGTSSDCLGFTSRNPEGRALIHLDTEQSRLDHHNMLARTLQRAQVKEAPSWLQSYCITGFGLGETRRALGLIIGAATRVFGGIHSVLLDGVADMVQNVNDPEECNQFVHELHAQAIQHACAIVCVIHLNPGSDSKTRGHLGSQLERKAEANLKIERDGDALVLWSNKNRRAPLLKNAGPRFAWSDHLGMHVSMSKRGQAKQSKETIKFAAEAELVLAGEKSDGLRHGELVRAVMRVGKLKEGGAKKHVAAMIRLGVIKKDGLGLYGLAS